MQLPGAQSHPHGAPPLDPPCIGQGRSALILISVADPTVGHGEDLVGASTGAIPGVVMEGGVAAGAAAAETTL